MIVALFGTGDDARVATRHGRVQRRQTGRYTRPRRSKQNTSQLTTTDELPVVIAVSLSKLTC